MRTPDEVDGAGPTVPDDAPPDDAHDGGGRTTQTMAARLTMRHRVTRMTERRPKTCAMSPRPSLTGCSMTRRTARYLNNREGLTFPREP